MKRLILVTLFVSFLTVGSIPMFSHCYEVGFKVMDSSSDLISISIEVYERYGGTRIDNGNLNSSLSGYNFRIDLNDNCPPYPPDCPVSCNIISLDPGTEYVIVFKYPADDKSVCYLRNELECPGGIYDTYYEVTPSEVRYETGSNFCEGESLSLYPDCCVILPLSVSLVVYDIDYIGDKVIFYLRATATGGDQNYNFSWSGASRTSPTSSTNPNTAKRTLLQSQSTTVTVTVTSDGQTVSKSKFLSGERQR